MNTQLQELFSQYIIMLQSNGELLARVDFSPLALGHIDLIQTILSQLPPDHRLTLFLIETLHAKLEVSAQVQNGIIIPDVITPLSNGILGVPKTSGVYILSVLDDSAQYIGSALNLKSRLAAHYSSLVGERGADAAHNMMNITYGGIPNIGWSVIYQTPNFLFQFLTEVGGIGITQGEYYVLQSLGELPVRVLEQSLLSEFTTSLNSSSTVLFNSIKSWSVSWLFEPLFSFTNNSSTQLYLASNQLPLGLPLASIAAAAITLGLSRNTVNRHLNKTTGVAVKTGVFAGLRILVGLAGLPLIDAPVNDRHPLQSSSLISLPGGLISDIIPNYLWWVSINGDIVSPALVGWVEAYNWANDLSVDNRLSEGVKPLSKTNYSNYLNKTRLLRTRRGMLNIVGSTMGVGHFRMPLTRPSTPWVW